MQGQPPVGSYPAPQSSAPAPAWQQPPQQQQQQQQQPQQAWPQQPPQQPPYPPEPPQYPPQQWQPAPPSPAEPVPEPPPTGLARAKAVVAKYGRMIWWLHSFYALGLGAFVVRFAQKGFAHARFLTISLALAWVVLILFFRFFGSGASQNVEGRSAKLRFFVMTYVLKNMYQGMLFFLLPFYWRSITLGSPNQWFIVGLGVCAGLATLDVVFDRMLMKWKLTASAFYFFTLFACLNLVIPALLPNTRSAISLTMAAAVSALAFASMHMPARLAGKPSGVVLLVLGTFGAIAGSYYGRAAVPPVAMQLEHGGVGPTLLPDGRLTIEASSLHVSLIRELYAVTDVMLPGGKGDRLFHIWRKGEEEIQRSTNVDIHPYGAQGTVRVQSKLASDKLPADIVGDWTVDVMTEDGQLVGRAPFTVIE
ncbi:MAG: DUF2914 domain-containing protein [Deltaproteobacteria bacterium]|nr:DUF2914 domain-containing protein [Nannocystaceae bacterium]